VEVGSFAQLTTVVPSFTHRLKQRVPRRWKAPMRRLGRFRWLGKFDSLRAAGVSPLRRPGLAARYILLDPEVDNFTYELENPEELAPFLAAALGQPLDRVETFLAEAAHDPELNSELTRRVRWRFDTKRRLPLGRRVLWYATVRLLRPGLVIETGVQEGLGSLVLLRALERNRLEGAPGRLISFDKLAGAGWLVPERLREGWRFVDESTETGLEPVLAGEQVDLLISDSGGSYERERAEYGAALRHAGPEIVLGAGSGNQTTALPEVASANGMEYHYFLERPRRHFFAGTGVAIARRRR
jgi:Methyltransferase domain